MSNQDTVNLIERLVGAGVDFVVIGGVASFVHGSTYATEDLDIAARFTEENITQLMKALDGLSPRHALTPGKRPIVESAKDIATWKNIYVWSDAGRLDVLGETPPVDEYEGLRGRAVEVTVGASVCCIASIEDLIAMKRALGRPKDMLVIEQLTAIRDQRVDDI